MIRVPVIEGVNESPSARYKRHSGELSFPCNAAEAVAFHKPKKKAAHWPYTIIALVIVASVAALNGCGSNLDYAPTISKVQSSAQKACPSGHSVEWIAANTMQCIKEQL